MKAILRTAAAAAALTLAATPALAAPQPQVQPTDRQATATARIVKPLTLVWAQDLDLGTVLLKNAGAYSATVGVTHAGVFSCPSTNVVCSGATKEAKYTVTGTPGQTVQVNTGNVTLNHPSNDPLLGLFPGGGDVVGAAFSGYIVYESWRLGVPASGLMRMIGNILADTLFGAVPIAGDLFDAVWKANLRNIDILRRPFIASRHFAAGFFAALLMLAAAVWLATN